MASRLPIPNREHPAIEATLKTSMTIDEGNGTPGVATGVSAAARTFGLLAVPFGSCWNVVVPGFGGSGLRLLTPRCNPGFTPPEPPPPPEEPPVVPDPEFCPSGLSPNLLSSPPPSLNCTLEI